MSISTSKLGSNSHAFTDDSLIIAINVDPMGSIYGSFLTGIKLQLSISLHTIDSTIAKGYLVPFINNKATIKQSVHTVFGASFIVFTTFGTALPIITRSN